MPPASSVRVSFISLNVSQIVVQKLTLGVYKALEGKVSGLCDLARVSRIYGVELERQSIDESRSAEEAARAVVTWLLEEYRPHCSLL